jgi:hypothetical protein
MDQCNPIGTIPTVDGTRPALMTPLMAGRGKGMGAALALSDVVQPKTAVVVDLQGQPPHDGGSDVGQRLHARAQQQDR